jgi:uncharacterized membrane protein
MAEDSSSPDKIKQVQDRLNYLESVARETVARLYEIEKRLGLVFRAVPRELGQSEHEAHLSRLEAVEDALKSTIPSESSAPDEPRTDADPTKQEDTQTGSLQTSRPPVELGPERRYATANYKPALPFNAQQPWPHASAQPPTAVNSEAHIPQAPPTAVHPITPATRADQMRQTQTLHSREARQGSPDLESRIGGRWLLWIGVIAISFGMAFFLKYAFDNQWITPGWRVNIGVAIGLAFLIGAERLRRPYPIYSHGLSGGGIFILYLSIFVGFNTYKLIPQTLAFVLMAAVTATASLLAARYSALPIAILGLIGGFLTPILLSTGVDDEAGLFGYIAVLDLGVLALAYSKHWRSLNYMAYGATVAMFASWMLTWYTPDKLWTTILFLTVLYMIFALLAVLHNVVNRRPTLWIDLAMVFSNALLYFTTSYELLDNEHHGILGLFAVLVSAFYMGLGYFAYSRDREDSLLIYTFLALAFLFAVLAVPIQLDQHWVTMGWALEGVAMTWIGLRANDRTSRYAALVVFAVAVGHWFHIDVQEFAYHANEAFLPLLNRRALSCAVLVSALAAAVVFYKRMKSDIEDEERSMFAGLYLLAANALAVILLSIDANDYFEQARAGAHGPDYSMSLGNTQALTLTALWAVYGVGTLFVGVTRRLKPLRYLGLLLLAGATVKVMVVDLNYYNASWHALILNQTFAAFALIIAALAICARFYLRGLDAEDEERAIVIPLLIGGANVLAIIALSAEIWAHFARMEAEHFEANRQFALSALWTIYGAVSLVIGIKRGTRALRIGALMLLALAITKVLMVDLRYYDAKWHTLVLNETFAALALLVFALAWSARSYTASEFVDRDESNAIVPLLVASANILALVALSAEALGYYAVKTGAGGLAAETRIDLHLAQQLSLSVVWAIYGGAMLTIGIARRSKLLRVMALVLLGLTILKVFGLDLSSLQKLYRTISLLVLGAILLGVSFLYQRYRQRIAELIGESDVDGPARSESH